MIPKVFKTTFSDYFNEKVLKNNFYCLNIPDRTACQKIDNHICALVLNSLFQLATQSTLLQPFKVTGDFASFKENPIQEYHSHRMDTNESINKIEFDPILILR